MIPLCENCGHGSDHHDYAWATNNSERACSVGNCSCTKYKARDLPDTVITTDTKVIPIFGKDHPSLGNTSGTTPGLTERCGFCNHRKLAHVDTEQLEGVGACHHSSGCQCPWFESGKGPLQMAHDRIAEILDKELENMPMEPVIDYVKPETMDSETFTRIVEEQIARSTSVLIDKAKEYASDTDRMHNFKVAAKLQNITPEQALGGFLAKHTVSIYDMIASGKEYPIAMWNEKITDHINYLLILRALVDKS